MAISERRFAAEFIDSEGGAHKFDDLVCMKSYLRDRNSRVQMTACFVTDYETRRWVPGPEAFYVSSPEFKTPMGGGIVAFADRARAERAASLYKSAVVGYRGVFE
jgi:copper chaperone NosL